MLLVVFAILIALSLCAFSLADFLNIHNKYHVPLLSLALCCYVFSFSMAWGSVLWVLYGEVFTTEHQGRDLAVISAHNMAFNFITVSSFHL